VDGAIFNPNITTVHPWPSVRNFQGIILWSKWQTSSKMAIYSGVRVMINVSDVLVLNYSASQKNPPWGFVAFYQTGWEFFHQILHAYYAFLSALQYKFLLNYLHYLYEVMPYEVRPPRSHHVRKMFTIGDRPKRTLAFSDIFCKQLGILVQILHAYYKFIFLFNNLQLWQSYAILSATTQWPSMRFGRRWTFWVSK